MAASSNERMKDPLTYDDIYRVLDIEDESGVFSEESDEAFFKNNGNLLNFALAE